MKIHEALAAVMADVKAVGKHDRNQQQGFSFRGIDGTLNAVGPVLRKHGVIVAPEVLNVERGDVLVGRNNTRMGHVVVTVRYRWIGPEGDHIDSVTIGEAMDSGDKAASKAMSVAFRTAMLQTLALPTDEPDPDLDVYERAEVSPADVARERLKAAMSSKGVPLQEAVGLFRERFGGDLRTSDDVDSITALAENYEKMEAIA